MSKTHRVCSNKKKYRIGFQIMNLFHEYSYRLLPGAIAELESHNADIILFPGETLQTPNGYFYQANVIYDFIRKENLDLLILAAGTLVHYSDNREIKDLIRSLGNLPIVSIGYPMPGHPSLMIEDRKGMRKLMDHLIHDHHYRNIAFIRGPEGSPEAKERYEGYREALFAAGMPYDAELILPGNFSEKSGTEAVIELLDKRKIKPDVIASSSDLMAIGAIRELVKRGINIPGDIAVTGFDGLESSRFHIPSLTTVRQPLSRLSKLAVETAFEILEGRKPEPLTLIQADPVVRSSCGCISGDSLKRPIPDPHQFVDKAASITSSRKKNWTESVRVTDLIPELGTSEAELIQRHLKDLHLLFQESEITREECQNFLMQLNGIWLEWIRNGREIEIWNRVFPFFFRFLEGIYSRQESQLLIAFLREKTSSLYGEISLIRQVNISKRLESRIFAMRETVQKISSTVDMQQLMYILARELPEFGITHAFIVTYKRPVQHTRHSVWKTPSRLELVLAVQNGEIRRTDQTVFSPPAMLPDNLIHDCSGVPLIVYPLFFMDEQFGYAIYNYSGIERGIYDFLSAQIGSAIKTVSMFKVQERVRVELKAANRELERYNVELQKISIRDELTGLFNRRGFVELSSKSISLAGDLGVFGAIIFADLDKLKHINDVYGHHEGDIAIQSAAEVLKKTSDARIFWRDWAEMNSPPSALIFPTVS